jgi:hypothetical protein
MTRNILKLFAMICMAFLALMAFIGLLRLLRELFVLVRDRLYPNRPARLGVRHATASTTVKDTAAG